MNSVPESVVGKSVPESVVGKTVSQKPSSNVDPILVESQEEGQGLSIDS